MATSGSLYDLHNPDTATGLLTTALHYQSEIQYFTCGFSKNSWHAGMPTRMFPENMSWSLDSLTGRLVLRSTNSLCQWMKTKRYVSTMSLHQVTATYSKHSIRIDSHKENESLRQILATKGAWDCSSKSTRTTDILSWWEDSGHDRLRGEWSVIVDLGVMVARGVLSLFSL